MAVITNEVLDLMNKEFGRSFQNAFTGAVLDYTKIATVVISTSAETTYGWLGQMPKIREWIGDRVLGNLTSHSYSIKNKDWENSVVVKRTDIEDDNLGIYTPLMSALGLEAAMFPDELMFGLLSKGHENLCYDGQNFFDTDHPVYPNNDGTGTVQTVSNIAVGTETPWYILATSGVLKPLIFQNRKLPVFTSMTKADDESVFMSNSYRYGADLRGNGGYGFWQMAFKSTQELNATNVKAAITAMEGFKADGGNPLNVKPTVIVAPRSLRFKAKELFLPKLANGADNPLAGELEVLTSAYL